MITTEEHKARHKALHKHLDELVADFIANNRNVSLSESTIMDLIQWSATQLENPTE